MNLPEMRVMDFSRREEELLCSVRSMCGPSAVSKTDGVVKGSSPEYRQVPLLGARHDLQALSNRGPELRAS
jgi:hypothetical protein